MLFLDEPTTGLDPISRARVWDYVRTINREMGVTIFLTTQYLEEADELAERVGIINRGLIVTEGTPAQLKRSVGSDVIVVNASEARAGAGGAGPGGGGSIRSRPTRTSWRSRPRTGRGSSATSRWRSTAPAWASTS